MVSSEHSVDELIQLVEEFQDRVATLEAENELLRVENERLRETVEEQAETIATLKACLKRYENAHTPPIKQRSATSDGDGDDEAEESSSNADTTDADEEARTDDGTVGRPPPRPLADLAGHRGHRRGHRRHGGGLPRL